MGVKFSLYTVYLSLHVWLSVSTSEVCPPVVCICFLDIYLLSFQILIWNFVFVLKFGRVVLTPVYFKCGLWLSFEVLQINFNFSLTWLCLSYYPSFSMPDIILSLKVLTWNRVISYHEGGEGLHLGITYEFIAEYSCFFVELVMTQPMT